MLFFKNKDKSAAQKPLISVCIPVYGTEKYLERCLKSVIKQDFDNFEIIILNDKSCGRDADGNNCLRIVKKCRKYCSEYRREKELWDISWNYTEHTKNRGTLEARRTLVMCSKGDYIFFIDPDDTLNENALKVLFEAAEDGHYDIVQGNTECGCFDENGVFYKNDLERNTKTYFGKVYGKNILTLYLEYKTSSVAWNKLFKRELLEKTFAEIPCEYIVYGEEHPLISVSFFYAKTFEGLKSVTYFYSYNSGITENKKIENINSWYMYITEADAFSFVESFLLKNKCFLKKTQLQAFYNKKNWHYSWIIGKSYEVSEDIKKEAILIMKKKYKF